MHLIGTGLQIVGKPSLKESDYWLEVQPKKRTCSLGTKTDFNPDKGYSNLDFEAKGDIHGFFKADATQIGGFELLIYKGIWKVERNIETRRKKGARCHLTNEAHHMKIVA